MAHMKITFPTTVLHVRDRVKPAQAGLKFSVLHVRIPTNLKEVLVHALQVCTMIRVQMFVKNVIQHVFIAMDLQIKNVVPVNLRAKRTYSMDNVPAKQDTR